MFHKVWLHLVSMKTFVSHACGLQAEAAFGANKWHTAAFGSDVDKQKFDRLMVHPLL